MKAAYYNYLMALKLYVSSGMPFYFEEYKLVSLRTILIK